MAQPAVSCPSDEQFRRFVQGVAPAGELSTLQAHIDACPDCMALLIELAQPDAQSSLPAAAAAPELAAPQSDPAQVEEYRLLRPLGSGAMGQVFLARDTLLDRLVAVKFPLVGQPSAAARERFFVEARAVARLSHPNVVRIYRVGEAAGRPYLVSELVPGRSLDQLPLPLPLPQVVHIGLGLCRGLGAAHQRGILHRDIKPANAILADDGTVKLVDFGLAKLRDAPPLLADEGDTLTDAAGKSADLTRTGLVMGTPRYMAPELWYRQAATERSDIYALGALLYELCAGRPPHPAKTLRELLRVVHKGSRPLREVARGVDRQLAEIIDRCLRKDPRARFATADELGQALAQWRVPGPPRVVAVGPVARRRRAVQADHRALGLARSTEITAVLDLLRRESLVLVAGDVGVGKSVLGRDGVLPAVAAGALEDGRRWSVRCLRLGASPLSALSDTLAGWFGVAPHELLPRLRSAAARTPQDTQGGLLLFVDQLEQLLSQSTADEAADVAELLGHLGGTGVRTLLAVRSEYLSRLAALPGLGEELTRALYLLRPLSAAAAFAQARRLYAGDPKALRRLGAAYRKLGQHDAAAAILDRARELLPADAQLRRLLALTHLDCGHLDAAREQASEMVRLMPDSARAWRLLGRLCLHARDWTQATPALQKAVVLEPNHRRAHRWLGEALLASNRAAEAVPCFERAAELGILRLSRPGGDS